MSRRVAAGVVSAVLLVLTAVGAWAVELHGGRDYDHGCEVAVAEHRADHPGDSGFDRAGRACQRHINRLEHIVDYGN